MKTIEMDTQPDLAGLLPGGRELLYREAPVVQGVLVREAFAFVRAHPELEQDTAGRGHRFLEHVRDLRVVVAGVETTIGAELFKVTSGGMGVLRPLLALVDGQTSLKAAMQLERDRLARAIRDIEESERQTA